MVAAWLSLSCSSRGFWLDRLNASSPVASRAETHWDSFHSAIRLLKGKDHHSVLWWLPDSSTRNQRQDSVVVYNNADAVDVLHAILLLLLYAGIFSLIGLYYRISLQIRLGPPQIFQSWRLLVQDFYRPDALSVTPPPAVSKHVISSTSEVTTMWRYVNSIIIFLYHR